MKIAYLSSSPLPSESASMIQSMEMCLALQSVGVQVAFFCPKHHQDVTNAAVMQWIEAVYGHQMPFPIHLSRYKHLKNRCSAIFSIPELKRKVAATGEYDYYFIRDYLLFDAMTRWGKPVIYEEHQWRYYPDWFRNTLAHRISVNAARRKACRLHLSNSEILRQHWINCGVPLKKTMTVHEALDWERFSPPLSRQQARLKLGLTSNNVMVSYVGSLHSSPTINQLIDAAALLCSVTFRFIGGPDDQRQRLSEKASAMDLPNVHIIGRIARNRISNHLFASDILIFNMNQHTLSHDILSPLKLFEFLAAARLIIAPDLPGMREMLSAPYTYFYTPFEENALIRAVMAAVAAAQSGGVEKFGNMARSMVRSCHTWSRRARMILEVLE